MQNRFISFMIILAALLAVLLIGALRRKAEHLLTFLFRLVTGTVMIYFINLAVASYNMEIAIGINPVTVLTSGILGFPGVLLLYGSKSFNHKSEMHISFYRGVSSPNDPGLRRAD